MNKITEDHISGILIGTFLLILFSQLGKCANEEEIIRNKHELDKYHCFTHEAIHEK